MKDLVSRDAVLELIKSRLNSAKKGSLEHQRLYSIYKSVMELPNENEQKNKNWTF